MDRGLTKPKVDWVGRSELLLPNLSESVQSLKEAYEDDNTSLGLIKPTNIIDFIKTENLELYEKNGWSFTINLDGKTIPKVTKIPHIFKYRFRCRDCGVGDHIMQCEDWELFESYRSWGKRYKDPKKLWEKLKGKYFHWMLKNRNLHFIMGMYSQYPTWFIIGIYYPPRP